MPMSNEDPSQTLHDHNEVLYLTQIVTLGFEPWVNDPLTISPSEATIASRATVVIVEYLWHDPDCNPLLPKIAVHRSHPFPILLSKQH